jgi:pimeloyl-ACP methyl ester carboxylesterase
MILVHKIIGFIINIVSIVSPRLAANLAIYLFTKPRKGYINEKQSDFLDTAFREELEVNDLSIMTYRWLGKGKTVLLAHGWESNAARWQYLIEPLKKLNYNIIALDAPAHGRSGSKRFNAILYADFIQAVSNKFKPDVIIGHSVGGMATAFSQDKLKALQIGKLVLIGTPSEYTDVLKRYFKMMSYNSLTTKAVYTLIKKRFEAEPIHFSTSKSLEDISSLDGLIIHDENDDVIPYSDALKINKSFKNSKLITTNGFDHSMIDESISNHIYEFLEN